MTPNPWTADPDDDPVDAAVVDAMIEAALGRIPRPIAWARLTAEQAAEVWLALDDWVRWLVARYALDHRDVPPCWYTHDDIVEELTALWTAHRAAYDPTGPPTGPADWHHTLAATRSRLQVWAGRTGCRHGEHRSATRPGWAADPAGQDAFLEFVDDDAAHRPSSG